MLHSITREEVQIHFDHAAMQDLERCLTREWLVTNGLGGYASGTISGVDTRHYHALLVAAMQPPVKRTALLIRLNEAVTVQGAMTELMTSEYRDGTIFPDGYTHIESFSLDDGLPTWTFRIAGSLLRRTVWMVPGHNVTVLRYKLAVGGEPVDLALRPLCAARDHHKVQHGDAGWHFAVEVVQDGVRVQATSESPPLWLLARGAAFIPAGDWYWGLLLRQERDRGYDHVEDLYQPGTFRATLSPGDTLTFIASAEDPTLGLPDPDGALAGRRSVHAHAVAAARGLVGLPGSSGVLTELTGALRGAAEQFIVRRELPAPGRQPAGSLIAGYHWFADWTRDAMIALPGLLLSTGRIDQAASLLRSVASYIDQGMVPNTFPDTGDPPDYAAVDASLLYFRALQATLAASADSALLGDLYPQLQEIIMWHMRGTRFGIGVDPEDGLLRAGESGAGGPPTQLTWMDACTDDKVLTPRTGKPVEINALWIEALSLMSGWATRFGDDPTPYDQALQHARASFASRFWYAAGGYLFDVVDGQDGDDPRLRPNQLFALAVNPPLLRRAEARAALAAVTEHLLTPYGLRTLSPKHPEYAGQCVGDQLARDRAYHQGTVWPWLLGPYVDACRSVLGTPPDLEALLQPFVAHLREAGLGTISEIFDGDPPHTPRGCISQAWSVGELLRIAGG